MKIQKSLETRFNEHWWIFNFDLHYNKGKAKKYWLGHRNFYPAVEQC